MFAWSADETYVRKLVDELTDKTVTPPNFENVQIASVDFGGEKGGKEIDGT